MRASISVIVPVYNESEAVESSLTSLVESLRGQSPFEIIAVDDGSNDGSVKILSELASKIPFIRTVFHSTNLGYGAALKTGIRHCKYDLVVITDADGTYPSSSIPSLVEQVCSGADMAVGARTMPGSKIPMIRRPAKMLLRYLAEYLSGQRIPDLNSGLRAMKKKVIERFWNILPDGFSFTTTMTLACLSEGRRVVNVPIEYFERGGRSKIRPVRDTLNFFQLVIRTVTYFCPLRVFVPLSLLFLVGAIAVGLGSWLMTGRVMDVTSVVLFVTGVQIMVAGMLADLIQKKGGNDTWDR